MAVFIIRKVFFLFLGFIIICSGFEGHEGVNDRCFLENQLCKWNPMCAQSHGNIVLRNFLVTGSGSSGTHWLRQSLRAKGFDIADESFGIQMNQSVEQGKQPISSKSVNISGGVDGMVAWTARCFIDEVQRRALLESDEGYGHILFPVGEIFRFRLVIHLIRHPLRAINSDLFFSNDIRYDCRSHDRSTQQIEINAAADDQPIETVCHWDWWRVQIWGFVSIFTLGVKNVGPNPEDNELFWTTREEPITGRKSHTFSEPIRLSANHWYRWNRQVELVADITVRVEDGELYAPRRYREHISYPQSTIITGVDRQHTDDRETTKLCDWLVKKLKMNPSTINCDSSCDSATEPFKNSHGGDKRVSLSWDALTSNIGATSSNRIRQLASSYGYE